MAQLPARIAEPLFQSAHADAKEPHRVRSVAAEILHPVEHLHQRFDDAYDRVEQLSALIQARQSQGFDCSALLEMLKGAEADKKASLAALRKVRWMKVVLPA